jgi:hypothetical protein
MWMLKVNLMTSSVGVGRAQCQRNASSRSRTYQTLDKDRIR